MSVSPPIRTVAVIGGGPVAGSAALALARALPRARVELVTMPVPASALADRLPRLWPSAAPLLTALGWDEAELFGRGIAAPVLARSFAHWSRTGHRWLSPEGEAVRVPGNGAIHQRWLHTGARRPFHELFPAAALAEAGRFSPDALARPDLAQGDLTLALAPDRFGALVAEGCRRAGVTISSGPLQAARPGPDGGWLAIRLVDGRDIAADLFVWAAGTPAPGEAWHSWAEVLPADRLLLAPGAPASLVDTYQGHEFGWRGNWALPGGGGAAADAFSSAIGAKSPADAEPALVLPPGRAAQGWTGNLLRLGEGAVQPGPLGLAGFTLAAHQLLLALELLPARDMAPVLVAEYNRRATMRAEHLRDFLAAHYLAGARRSGPFWAPLAKQAPPPSLAMLLTQFARRGHLPHRDEESVAPDAWRAVLLGQGLRPTVPDPVVLGSDRTAEHQRLTSARDLLATATSKVPLFVPFS